MLLKITSENSITILQKQLRNYVGNVVDAPGVLIEAP